MPSPLVGFALDDAIVVGAVKREILLWRSRDGALLGRLLPVGRGWAFAPEGMGATGTGPIELFGDVDELALLCAAEDLAYPWAVCSDYFERPGAFARMLGQAEEARAAANGSGTGPSQLRHAQIRPSP